MKTLGRPRLNGGIFVCDSYMGRLRGLARSVQSFLRKEGVKDLFRSPSLLFVFLVEEIVERESCRVNFFHDGIEFFFQFLDVFFVPGGDIYGLAALFAHPHLFEVVEAVVLPFDGGQVVLGLGLEGESVDFVEDGDGWFGGGQ